MHVLQLQEQKELLKENNIQVAVITFDSNVLAQNYVNKMGLSWPVLVDSKRSLYKTYGIPQANLWTLLRPTILFRYIETMVKGYLPGRPGCDLRQLGGNVLIDPEGIVRMNHVSTDPFDHPTAEYIVETTI